jgi:hypothetical protein
MAEVDYVEVNRKAHELTYTHGPTAHGYADRQAQRALAADKTDEYAFWKAVGMLQFVISGHGIRTGLAGGDNKALADRLMLIERRIVALEQQGQETHALIQSIDQAARDLLAMFEAQLKALTGDSTGRAA